MICELKIADFLVADPKRNVVVVDESSLIQIGSGECSCLGAARFEDLDVLYSSSAGFSGGGGLAYNLVYGRVVKILPDESKILIRRFPNDAFLRIRVELAVRSQAPPYITVCVEDVDSQPDETPTKNVEDFLTLDRPGNMIYFAFWQDKKRKKFSVEPTNKKFLHVFEFAGQKVIYFVHWNEEKPAILLGWFTRCNWRTNYLSLNFFTDAERQSIVDALSDKLAKGVVFAKPGDLFNQ